jgi:hypothetical protein
MLKIFLYDVLHRLLNPDTEQSPNIYYITRLCSRVLPYLRKLKFTEAFKEIPNLSLSPPPSLLIRFQLNGLKSHSSVSQGLKTLFSQEIQLQLETKQVESLKKLKKLGEKA